MLQSIAFFLFCCTASVSDRRLRAQHRKALRAASTLVDPDTTTTSTTPFKIWTETPGLGWGKAPATDEYTTPLCFQRGLATKGAVMTTVVTSPANIQTVTYKSTFEINSALRGGSNEANIVGQALQAAVKSLLAHTSGQLKEGYELLHSQYNIPVVEHTIQWPAQSCNSPPIEYLRRIAKDTHVDASAIDTFLGVHGTHVVSSVVLGGHLSLFHLQKKGRGKGNIALQSGSMSMSSSSTHMSVLGGRWEAQTSNASSENLQQAIDAWMQTVQNRQNLKVLTQQTVPIHVLLPSELEPRIHKQVSTTIAHSVQQKVSLAAKLTVAGKLLAEAFHTYTSTSWVKAQAEALSRVVPLVADYCDKCSQHSALYNIGFVGMHSVPPARCKSICYRNVLRVCKDALPRLVSDEEVPNEFKGMLIMLGQYPTDVISGVIYLATEYCNRRDPLFAAEGWEDSADHPKASGLIQVSTDDPHQDEDKDEGKEDHAPKIFAGLGWGVSPVSDTYTVPVCSDDSGRIDGVVMTPSSEPMMPMISSYHNHMELEVSLTDSFGSGISNEAVVAMIKRLLASTDGKLSGDSQLIHISYYIPVGLQVISDPMSACKKSRLADLATQFDAGNLSDKDIDRFLLSHGTRIASSIVRGGRLDIVALQKKGDVDLRFMSTSPGVNASFVQTDMNLNVLGGKWEPHLGANNASATLEQAVQQWVESVQNSTDLPSLAHTTIPVTSLLPTEMQGRIASRIKNVTNGWISSVKVLETARFLQTKVVKAKQSFETIKKRAKRFRALSEIVKSLGEFCDASSKYSEFQNVGFVDTRNDGKTPAGLTRFCWESLSWTCQVAIPKMKEDPGIWKTFLKRKQLLDQKRKLVNYSSHLCSRLDQ